MGIGPIVVTVVIILVISAVVGAIAQFLNKVNDANAVNRRAVPPPRAYTDGPPPAAGGVPAGAAKPVDMDRFLAEIDRLRRKNAQASGNPEKQSAQPVKPPPEKPRPRVVAEVSEPRGTSFPSAPPTSFPSAPPLAFPTAPTAAPPGGQVTRLADLPQATPITATGSTGGAQPTRVTAPPRRASAAPKTEFGKAFASLIGTGKGAAMAVVLAEVFGPPKAKKH